MKALNHSETADDCAGVFAQLGEGWRVVVCRGNHQWILQRRKKGAGRRWEARGYFRTQKALRRVATASCVRINPTARDALDALPDFYGEGAI